MSSGVNFINVLLTAFALIDPESVKKIDNLTVFNTLLGSAGVKGVRRTLMKSSPAGQNGGDVKTCVQRVFVNASATLPHPVYTCTFWGHSNNPRHSGGQPIVNFFLSDFNAFCN